MELAQVRLLVADFPACYRFYAEVLGLKPQSGAAEGPYEKFSAATGSAGIALQDRAMMARILGELGDSATGTAPWSSCASMTSTPTAPVSSRAAASSPTAPLR